MAICKSETNERDKDIYAHTSPKIVKILVFKGKEVPHSEKCLIKLKVYKKRRSKTD